MIPGSRWKSDMELTRVLFASFDGRRTNWLLNASFCVTTRTESSKRRRQATSLSAATIQVVKTRQRRHACVQCRKRDKCHRTAEPR